MPVTSRICGDGWRCSRRPGSGSPKSRQQRLVKTASRTSSRSSMHVTTGCCPRRSPLPRRLFRAKARMDPIDALASLSRRPAELSASGDEIRKPMDKCQRIRSKKGRLRMFTPHAAPEPGGCGTVERPLSGLTTGLEPFVRTTARCRSDGERIPNSNSAQTNFPKSTFTCVPPGYRLRQDFITSYPAGQDSASVCFAALWTNGLG